MSIPRRPGGRTLGGDPTMQTGRAVAIMAVLVVVAVLVLARMNGSSGTAKASAADTTKRSTTTTTVVSASTTSVVATTTTTTLPPVALSAVKLAVLNGTGTAHGAAYYKSKLGADGYNTLPPGDATTTTVKSSVIFVVTPADRSAGLSLAKTLGLSTSVVVDPTAANDTVVPASTLHSADLILVLGTDLISQVPTGYTG
jgi:hypothetical protein